MAAAVASAACSSMCGIYMSGLELWVWKDGTFHFRMRISGCTYYRGLNYYLYHVMIIV